MGEVYRATDVKLGRDVALKVLPEEMARDPKRLARFQREARAVAALNHPHIVTIFSVEEVEGVHFLTMELVEGQTLDRLIPKQGFPLERLLEIVIALAEALAAAHEKGIVHRDLKPANVMVTNDGRVKVLDFGLAKETRAEGVGDATLSAAERTEAGVVMGTPAYMSPEQVTGDAVDHRTDIFSLGIILYEMATGRRPFQGRSSAELASAILRDTPRAVSDVRADLPGDLARVIRRCLEKDARRRVQTARDVGNELRELARQPSLAAPAASVLEPTGASAAGESGAARADEGFWVAVLPVSYSGANAELTALAEGLSEGIVTGLSRFSYLRVIARGSTARFKSEAVDVRAAGKELGARYVMEGSLRQAGATLRIAVQLVDANTGAHLWAESYDRPFRPEAIFELQDEVVPRIVSTVADAYGVLPHSMSEALRGRAPEELSPYEALLRSFSYAERLTVEEHAAARAALERAVEQAPGHADCWAMLSMNYADEYKFDFNVQQDPLGRALQAARRAVDTAPSNPSAHNALAQALFFRKEFQAFRNAAERAVALNPMDGAILGRMGMLMAFAGDWERGCAMAERAMQLNLQHPGWYRFPAFYNAYRKGDYRGALDVALNINMPGFFNAIAVTASTYGQLGERDAAAKALRELFALRPDFAGAAREWVGKWFDPELGEQVIEGLRKAGLSIPAEKATAGPAALAPKSESVIKQHGKALAIAGAAVVIAALAIGGWLIKARHAPALTERDTIVLADFTNATGEEVFDDALKQALAVDLGQSPFLNILSNEKVRATLRQMTRLPSERLTEETAREVCQRAGSKAFIAGSIAGLGNQYVIGLNAVNCATGDSLAREQVQAAGKERVLEALGSAATKLRSELGESLRSVQRFDVPLDQATTSSLEALKAFSLGQKAQSEKGSVAGIPFYERAIELDPNFARAQEALGVMYSNIGQPARANVFLAKAFELREHASEREKFYIATLYYQLTTGEMEKAIQTYGLWTQSYPRDDAAFGNLSGVYAALGQYEKAVEAQREGLRLNPDSVYAYENLAGYYLALNRFPEARDITAQALARKLDDYPLHTTLYLLEFVQSDSAGMARQAAWFEGKAESENAILALESDAEAYHGRLDKARELTRRVVASAESAQNKESAALWSAEAALREALFGNYGAARERAAAALSLAPGSHDAESEAALALALAGDVARAQALTDDLNKRFPLDTVIQLIWLRAIRAAIEINRKTPSSAIELLQAAAPYELGVNCINPAYIRGEAYLGGGQGVAAASEFQKFLDHRGIVQACPAGAMAHLQVGRAYAMQGDTAKARAAYQDFLTLWKDADPDIPVLKQAKAEYAKLQ